MTLQDRIIAWIKDYANHAGMKSLVVGISGGIDSAVVSALCARTGLNTIAVSMPIRQRPDLHDLSMRHGVWLAENFNNVRHETIDLTTIFDGFENTLARWNSNQYIYPSELGLANSRSRLRMVTLYQIAQSSQGIVVGTGNKVEDFGVGFYTKYGDGGVDISPIADCYKTEVWQMGRELGVLEDIIDAAPTDGLCSTCGTSRSTSSTAGRRATRSDRSATCGFSRTSLSSPGFKTTCDTGRSCRQRRSTSAQAIGRPGTPIRSTPQNT